MGEDRKLLSIAVARTFLMVVGFWLAKTPRQEMVFNCALYYTVGAVFFAIAVESVEFYQSLGNFSDLSYVACNIMALIMVLYKVSVFSVHRKKFMEIIEFTQRHYWNANYDELGMATFHECEKKSLYFMVVSVFFAQGTVWSYVARPLIENLSRNGTDRALPFTIYLDLPVTVTPYYEMTFAVQILSLYHCGICYICFDNLMCIYNIYAAGQFRIYRRRLELICQIDEADCANNNDTFELSRAISGFKYNQFKGCIAQHQALVCYIRDIEDVYTFSIFGQVLFFSVMICLVGYQALLDEGPISRRFIFMVHSVGTFVQLLMFTLSCHDLIHDSLGIADGAYHSGWHHFPWDPIGYNLRRDVLFVIMRARRPSCLTAGGFFPVSLATFMSILSTALSYFTLLRRQSEKR